MAGQLHFSGHPQLLIFRNLKMTQLLRRFWFDDSAQDVAEYAVMLAVVLTVTLMTIRLIGKSSDNVFSEIGSKLS